MVKDAADQPTGLEMQRDLAMRNGGSMTCERVGALAERAAGSFALHPGGRPAIPRLPAAAVNVPPLMTALGTANLVIGTPAGRASLIVLRRRPVAALAIRGGTLVSGADAIDALAELTGDDAAMVSADALEDAEAAAAAAVSTLPPVVPGIELQWIADLPALVCALTGRRGTVLITLDASSSHRAAVLNEGTCLSAMVDGRRVPASLEALLPPAGTAGSTPSTPGGTVAIWHVPPDHEWQSLPSLTACHTIRPSPGASYRSRDMTATGAVTSMRAGDPPSSPPASPRRGQDMGTGHGTAQGPVGEDASSTVPVAAALDEIISVALAHICTRSDKVIDLVEASAAQDGRVADVIDAFRALPLRQLLPSTRARVIAEWRAIADRHAAGSP